MNIYDPDWALIMNISLGVFLGSTVVLVAFALYGVETHAQYWTRMVTATIWVSAILAFMGALGVIVSN